MLQKDQTDPLLFNEPEQNPTFFKESKKKKKDPAITSVIKRYERNKKIKFIARENLKKETETKMKARELITSISIL